MSRPRIKNVLENTDADGNRGQWLSYIECKRCGHEFEEHEMGYENCPECDEELDWNSEDEYEMF